MDLKLTQLNIQGFKSFGKEQNIRFGDITIFIGANGSGKSNLMSFFEMLQWMVNKQLGQYVASHGGWFLFTHLGEIKAVIETEIFFQKDFEAFSYDFNLSPSSGESFLLYSEEIFQREISGKRLSRIYRNEEISRESSGLQDFVKPNNENAGISGSIWAFLKKTLVYRFNDTSRYLTLGGVSYINNTGYLMSNGDNLAPFLYGMQQSPDFSKYYERIVRNIRLAYPSFDEFILEPNLFYPDNVRLDWRDKNCPPNFRFSPQQLSDGTLRFMALTALLLQPPETIPKVIVIDEPELGLHPTALSLLASMIFTASKHSQVVIATQSAQLLDYFEPEHIRVVEREGSNSIVREPDLESLKYWLEEYSLGQVWEKNIIGGRP